MDEENNKIIELEQRLTHLENVFNKLEMSDRYLFQKHLQMLEGSNIMLGVNVGTRIGTDTTQKVAFFGVAPVAQQTAITAPTGGATVDSQSRTAIGTIITVLQRFGLTL